MRSTDNHICEYCDCEEEGTVFDEEIHAWVCEKHSDMITNSTGYCGQSCMLGYGCDGSC